MIENILYISTTLVATLIAAFYIYKKWSWSYWNRRGLETYEPDNFMDIGSQYYKSYFNFKKRGLKHGGTFLFFLPHYIPVDIDIIKRILIADFDNFVNRGLFEVQPKADDISAHLFNLKDERWRVLRNKLSPTFTSGKLKMMFQTLTDTTPGLENIFQEYAASQQPFEMKEVLARYTTDVIGSTAFGINCNSLKNPDSQFRMFGKAIMDNVEDLTTPLFLFSSLPKYIRMGLFSLWKQKFAKAKTERFQATEFFKNVVKETVEYREKNNVQRNDFLHLLLLLKNKGTVDEGNEASKDSKNKSDDSLTINQIAAQCFVFFIGGYDTSSTAMTFALYELAKHPEMQEKLRKEIHQALATNGGKMSYDVILSMKYLDQVVNETLRLHPPVKFLSRQSNQDYLVPGTDFILKKHEIVIIPVDAVHKDPDLYPEPERFNPGRFSPENKGKMNAIQILPFGEGPRMCIGSRFGLMQTKVGLACVLNKFRVTLNNKTKEPLELSKSFLTQIAIDGIWFNIEAI